MRCIHIAASDDRMDCRESFYDPINALPAKCPKCGFPDLDHIPQPYFLIKSRTMTPNELAAAENGNFFVRERIRRVLDLLAPNQCCYFPTCYKGTSQTTPWLLAVPKHQVASAKVDPSIPRCEACGEPRSAHPGSQWRESLLRSQLTKDGWTCELDYEVVKSSTWGSTERGWDQWISQDLFMSLRLLHLLKKIKAKGFVEATCEKPQKPNKDESTWIELQLQVLEAAGIPFHAEGTLSDEIGKWFRGYLKANAQQVEANWEIKAIERRLKAKLPKSYVDFVTIVGPVSFTNVDDQEGFSVSILAPDKLGMEGHAEDLHDEESKAVNGLMFASTGHGDYFAFDVQKAKKEFAVFLFKHEYNCFEPYADDFAACIQRLAGKD